MVTERRTLATLPLPRRAASVRAWRASRRSEVREALRTVLFPNFKRDIVTLGMVGDDIQIEGGAVRVHLRPGTRQARGRRRSSRRARRGRRSRACRASTRVEVARRPGRGGPRPRPVREPRRAARRARTSSRCRAPRAGSASRRSRPTWRSRSRRADGASGSLDADVYGPSLPIMLGTDARPQVTPEKRIVPVERYGAEAHVDGVLPRRDVARHLARPDRHGDRAPVPARRRVGNARLPGRRPARPARAMRSSRWCSRCR